MPLNSQRRRLLSTLVPEGLIVTRQWLLENGFDRHAIDNLIKSEQLRILKNGVYSRGEGVNSWQDVVIALQKFQKLDCVVGGLTALELQGLAHYLPLSAKQVINLFSADPVPKWVSQFSTDITFRRYNSRKVLPNKNKKNIELFTASTPWRQNIEGLIVSRPERAMLEVLYDVPDKISFAHANELMQGMTAFVPRVVQAMLEQCANVKCKRLFLWLAERQNHAWFSRIDLNKIDLGSGNRVLVKGGKLDEKYRITVPKEIVIDRDLF